jgi:hypothetical protein
MIEELSKHILLNPFGAKSETIIINDQNYEISFTWDQNIKIEIKHAQRLLKDKDFCELKKNRFLSFITRSPNYSIYGKRSELTEKLLSNKYTPALLNFRASKLHCENNKISYTATLRKKQQAQLEKIRNYFEALLNSL